MKQARERPYKDINWEVLIATLTTSAVVVLPGCVLAVTIHSEKLCGFPKRTLSGSVPIACCVGSRWAVRLRHSRAVMASIGSKRGKIGYTPGRCMCCDFIPGCRCRCLSPEQIKRFYSECCRRILSEAYILIPASARSCSVHCVRLSGKIGRLCGLQ
jgi:hypothetical protein